MKNIPGALRIYIVLSCVWFVYFIGDINFGQCLGTIDRTYNGVKINPDGHFLGDFFTCNPFHNFYSLLPIPLYFVLNWVSEGFNKK